MLLRTKTIPASSSSRARAVRVCAQNVSYSSQTVASTSHPVSTSTSSSAFCSQETRAPWWTALGAVAVITTASICPDAHAAYATAQPPSSYADAQVKREEGRYDENLMTKELKSFLEVLEKKGNSIKFEELQQQRLKVNFRRSPAGQVSLLSPQGRWYNVKADMQTPGFLLLRDEASGAVSLLPPDDSGRLLQVDLSDDAVVAQLFSSGAWADVVQPMKVDDNGAISELRLSESEFRGVLSLLDGAVEEGVEEAQ